MKTQNNSTVSPSWPSGQSLPASNDKAPSLVRLLLLSIAAIGVTLPAPAQIQQAWVARYNNGITNGTNQTVKMALDSIGNIYVTGISQNAYSNLGYVTIKYAPNGNPLWTSRCDSTNYPAAEPAALALDGSNDVIVTGTALTIKYDPNGNQLWSAPYAGTALAVDGSANVYVSGFSWDFGVLKLTPQGSNVWLRTFVEPYGATIVQSLLVDGMNNVYASGLDTDNSYVYNNHTFTYVTLTTIKYDPNGHQLWKVSQAPLPNEVYVTVGGAMLDGSNNLYLTANYQGSYPYTTFKYASSGSVLWVAYPTFSGQAQGLAINTAGYVVLTGFLPYYSAGDYATFGMNSDGATIWTSCYPNTGYGFSSSTAVALDSANNAYVTGYSPGTNTSNDIVTIMYDANGNRVWLQRYKGPGNGDDEGNAIAVDGNGNVYVAGCDTTAAGGTEMVLIKYAPVTLQRRSDGTVLLQAQGLAGESFDFQGSTDLMNWLDLGSVLADSNGVAQFQDTNASNYNWRFYITSPQ
jgi:hypothetical protein